MAWFESALVNAYQLQVQLKEAEDKKILSQKHLYLDINVEWAYKVYLYLLSYSAMPIENSKTEWQLNSKMFLYYLYAVIVGNQKYLLRLHQTIKTDKYLNYIRNTLIDWEKDVLALEKRTMECFIRFSIYEAELKKAFNIPLGETNLNEISKKFVPFEYITSAQIEIIEKKIVDPIFMGTYVNVFKSPILYLLCDLNENGDRTNCKIKNINYFPFPQLDINNKIGTPDCKEPLYIFNAMKLKQEIGLKQSILWLWDIDTIISYFTGINKGYKVAFGAWIDQKVDDAVQFKTDMSYALNELKNDVSSLAGAIYNLPGTARSIGGSIADYWWVAGLGIVGFMWLNRDE